MMDMWEFWEFIKDAMPKDAPLNPPTAGSNGDDS
jgi:hypothetical protein